MGVYKLLMFGILTFAYT